MNTEPKKLDTWVIEKIEKEYKDDITIEEALKLTIKALYQVIGEDLSVERLDCVYIKSDEKKYTSVPQNKLSQVLDEVKKNKK